MSHSDHKWIDRVKTFVRNLRDAQDNAYILKAQSEMIDRLLDRCRDEKARADFLERDNEELLRLTRPAMPSLVEQYEVSVEDNPVLQTIDINLEPIRGRFSRFTLLDMGGCRALAEEISRQTGKMWRDHLYHTLCDHWNVPKERR